MNGDVFVVEISDNDRSVFTDELDALSGPHAAEAAFCTLHDRKTVGLRS